MPGIIPIGILIAIGLASGLVIYWVYLKVPHKVKGLEKAEEISAILPGADCGACGKPGCFGYAQAVAQDPNLVTKTPCTLLQDPESLGKLEKALGITIDPSAMSKIALIHCGGNSETIYHYSGVETCKAAAQLLSGYRRCPYACLGLEDCAKVCPVDAIFTDQEKNIAVVDPEKCIGCGLCIAECPLNLIELVPGETKITFLCNYGPLKSIPGRERCEYACTHCRKCFKVCEDEAIVWNKEKAVPEFIQEKCTRCGKCIEVCESNTLAEIKIEEKVLSRISKAPGEHCTVPAH